MSGFPGKHTGVWLLYQRKHMNGNIIYRIVVRMIKVVANLFLVHFNVVKMFLETLFELAFVWPTYCIWQILQVIHYMGCEICM